MKEKPFILKLRAYLLILFFSILLIYFGFRIFDFISGPRIKITNPINGQKIETDIFLVEGNVKNAKNIYINGREIGINQKGDFKEGLIAKSPYTIIVISAYDKYGKFKEKVLQIVKD